MSWRLSVLLLLVSAALLEGSALPAVSSYEFTAFRMQQYNLGRHKYGCRGAFVVAEARTVDEPVLMRRCVVMKVSDFTVKNVLEAQKQKAAAILVLLPRNMSSVSPEDRQSFMEAEAHVLQKESLTPLYVTPEDEQLLFMYQELRQTVAFRTSSIFIRVLRSMVTSTAFQILVSNNSPIKPITETTVHALEGVLQGAGEDPPTIVVTATYDSYGLAPWLSFGADSNASGVTLLLELIRLFSKMYSSPRTRPQFNLMFALSGGGKYNFIGTKRWIEENVDHAETSFLQQHVSFVLCLDTLGGGESLFAHVSRPPHPNTPLGAFTQILDEVISSRFPSLAFGVVHKKINLGESLVSWEHERFSLRRVPAFTLSRLEDPKDPSRGSVLDTRCVVEDQRMRRSGVLVAEALGRFMFNLSHLGSPRDLQLFRGQLELHDSRMSSLLTALASVPRAAQLLDQDPNQVQVLDSLELEFRQYLRSVRRYSFTMDKREPEITFFDQMKQPIVMYRVKPAAFDLFLGGCIAVYLGLVYSAVQNFGLLYSRLKAAVRSKTQ
ncbi:nicalin-1-like [Periophthalmus magnuspinnatus]|uniref:nicalin-1-like n=1 Tax=Periophthalmus magnuspinnatus TaxID=409849 RepID=UPI00145A8C45|nr:nicalin-1-like [Periophthalmus magnuspinnatus]